MPGRNIELKARCSDLAAAERIAISLGGRFEGVLHQIDTYFKVPHGRLKLREINGESVELIRYERANDAASRPSDYTIAALPKAQPLRDVIANAVGILVQVRKQRRLFIWQNVRIHLDQVADLGDFLEFEAVISDIDSEAISRQRVEQLIVAFQIKPSDYIAESYSDLAMRHVSCRL